MTQADQQLALSRGLTVLLGAGLLLFILLGTLAFGQYRAGNRHADAVARTLEAQTVSAELGEASLQLESEQRGFLLTGSEAYISNYSQARDRVSDRVTRLRELTQDRAGQAGTLAHIEDTLSGKISELDETIALARDGRRNEALAIVNTDKGKALMDALRADIDAVRVGEQAAYTEAEALRSRAQRNLNTLALAAILAAIALGVLTTVILRRNALSVLSSQRQTTRAVAAQGAAEAEQTRVETMLEEMNHRIGNSLGMVSALLGMQRTRSDNEDVRAALATARTRLAAVATAHRRLRLGPDMETTDLAPVLSGMAEDLRAMQPRQDIALQTDFVSIIVSDRDAVTLGLLMSELIVNAFKHAFEGREGGTVWAETYFDDDGALVLRVQDDGVGMSAPSDVQGSKGLGTSVVARMSRQFKGEIDYAPRNGGGACIALRLPGLKRAS